MHSNGNHLIQSLPQKDRDRLVAASDAVQLELAEVLCEPGAVTRHVYFPTGGFVSLVAKVEGSGGVEVGMVGREGMLGSQVALDVCAAPLHALVQGAGTALRVTTAAFSREMKSSPPLQRLMKRYIYVLMIQLSHSAACQRFHMVNARLARWLLMSEDRAQADTFYVTQEFLAYMLGVRRVGVTNAASTLQHDGLIEYHRGEMHVLNRRGLEMAACTCYEADRSSYTEILGLPSSA